MGRKKDQEKRAKLEEYIITHETPLNIADAAKKSGYSEATLKTYFSVWRIPASTNAEVRFKSTGAEAKY